MFGTSSVSSIKGVINNYEESGDGWSNVIEVTTQTRGTGKTEITRTYRDYKQYDNGNSYWNNPYWGSNIWGAGCGPTSLAIIASGYHIDIDPGDVVDIIHNNGDDYTNSAILGRALDTLGIEHKIESVGDVGTSTAINNMKRNLENGNPVAVGINGGRGYSNGGHWMAIVGIKGDTITIANPGGNSREDNITEFVNECMSGCSYILITDNRESISSDSVSSRSSSYTREKSSSRSKNSSLGAGNAKIDNSYKLENGGYSTIFTSGTTGRQFKEYKQNIPGWDSKYTISNLSGTNRDWTGECGLVSAMIVGSGYSKSATFEDATKKMINSNGWTNIPGWAGEYASQSANFVSYDSSDMVNKLSEGCVAIIHGTSSNVSSGGTHYMAILDIKPDKSAVYVSNPWNGSQYQGWISVSTVNSDFGADSILYLSNDGSKVNYGSGKQIDSLDNFLVIGDSRTYAIENKLEALGKNVVAKGVSASTPQHWKEVTKNGSGTVLNNSVTLPSKNSVKGVAVALGVNGTSQVSEMKEVLNNLIARYPDVPIFVTSVFHVGEKYQYGTLTASKMNDNIDSFNNSMKEFCNSNSNLIYIDITSGLYDDKGFLKSSYTDDGLHLNNSGNTILVKNIKEEILNSGLVSSSDNNGSDVNMSSNIIENGRNGYKINADWDKEVEEMLKKLKEKNFKLEKYLDKSVQKEYLKNMLKAAIVTQYPDLRSAEEIAKDKEMPADETQGCIKVKRYADDETRAFAGNSLSNPIDNDDEDKGMYLAYMPYKEFSKLITSADKSALNYFSMDSSNNLVVAGWETLDVSVTIEQIEGDPDPNPDSAPEARAKEYAKLVEKKINYVDQVSNYTMPFSYLWTLLVYGNDEAFVNDVAKLVIDTEIVITSYDATNVKVTTYEDTYVKKYNVYRKAGIGNYVATEGGYQGEATSTEQKKCKYKVTEIQTLKTDTLSLKVKYANTWTAIYNNGYKVKKKQEDPEESYNDNFKNEIFDSTYDYKYNEETEDVMKDDEALQKSVDEQIEKLREETSQYNNQKFGYRYDVLNEVLPEEPYMWLNDVNAEDYIKLLYDEDVQNYIINMIINENSQEYILDTFVNNETIRRCAKKINENNYLDIQKGAGACAQRLVRELETNNLKNKLTKNGTDTASNKIYSSEVTSIVTEESVSHENRTETITTNLTRAEVEEVTSTDGKVTMKTDKNSDENSFVKLLYHSKKAKGNLKIIGSWFFESMEETAAIADMVDLTKFLLQKVYNEKIEYTNEEIKEILNLFDPEKFQIASGSNSSNGNYSTDLEKFIFGGEGGDEYIKGDIYIVYDIGDGCLNIGHGVVIGKSDGTPEFPELIPNPHVGQEISKEIHDKVYELKMKRFTSALDASLAKYGVTLKQHQYDAMISFLYNTGYGNSDIAVCAYKNGGDEGFWNEIKQYINPPQYRLGLMRRRAEEYELFTTGDYNYNPIYDGDRVKYY